MPALPIRITDAGLAAVQGASGSNPTVITTMGLSASAFDYAPTLTALPGEFKRLDVASGVAAAPNVTHLTAYDTSADTWSATSFGLYLADGTLFAVYAGAAPVMNKAAVAWAMLACDIAFNADFAANIGFGNATFVWPPATEQTRGIARIGTQAIVDAGADDAAFVTALKLARRLAPVLLAIAEEAAARGQADTALSAAIGNEATARSGADDFLQEQIDALETAYTAADVLAKLITVDGEGSALDADLLDGYHGSAYDRIVDAQLIENNGYEAYASGKKITWGRFNIPRDGYVTFLLPVPHTTWVHPVLGISSEGGNTSIQDNTGITEIVRDVNNAPTGVRIWNADDRTVTVWIRTMGV